MIHTPSRIDPPPFVIDRSLPAMKAWAKLPEGVLAEVINDKLYVSPSPTPYHQRVSLKITVEMLLYAEQTSLGEVFCAPTDLFLPDHRSVIIPDIIFISKDNSLIVDRKGLHGVPDLLIEILSPSTRRRDLTLKKDLFERTGVKEYWIIDPDTKNSTGYLLEKEKYGEPLLMTSEIYIRILSKLIKF